MIAAAEKIEIVSALHAALQSRSGDIAISSPRGELTYREFAELADRCRQRLIYLGVAAGDIVAVHLPASPEFSAFAFATMSLGAAYLPIDENCPAQRIQFMILDSGARALITAQDVIALQALPVAQHGASVNAFVSGRGSACAAGTQIGAVPDSIAYMIYTSGSTGNPKGVEVTHAGLMNLVEWHNSTFKVTQHDRASHIAGLGFDAAVWEVWPYLARGATVCIPDSFIRQNAVALRKWLLSERITIAFAPTVIAEALLRLHWPANASLRILLTGGEALRSYPPGELPFAVVNNYGLTECTVVTTSGVVGHRAAATAPPSIGRPIAATQVYILDEKLTPVRSGEVGEICVAGPSLARGYCNRPDLTRERFVPFNAASEGRICRTGDLGRFLPDGQIEFVGRIDDQIKIRGFRIEPGEIALTINQHPSVQQCVVAARDITAGEKQLVAYIVPACNAAVDVAGICELIQRALPSYMMPFEFVTVEKIALTPNGKADLAALRAVHTDIRSETAVKEEPQTDCERQIAVIVKRLLKVRILGRNDNFFLLGGHSLFAAQLIDRLSKRFHVQVPLRSLFASPTVVSLAAEIERLVTEPNRDFRTSAQEGALRREQSVGG